MAVLVFAVLMVVKLTVRARRSVKAKIMPRRCTGSIAASIYCQCKFSVDTCSSALASECIRARRRIVVLQVGVEKAKTGEALRFLQYLEATVSSLLDLMGEVGLLSVTLSSSEMIKFAFVAAASWGGL